MADWIYFFPVYLFIFCMKVSAYIDPLERYEKWDFRDIRYVVNAWLGFVHKQINN